MAGRQLLGEAAPSVACQGAPRRPGAAGRVGRQEGEEEEMGAATPRRQNTARLQVGTEVDFTFFLSS